MIWTIALVVVRDAERFVLEDEPMPGLMTNREVGAPQPHRGSPLSNDLDADLDARPASIRW